MQRTDDAEIRAAVGGIVAASQAKRALLNATEPADVAAVISTVKQAASDVTNPDHLAYAKLFLAYTVGTPRTSPQMPAPAEPLDLSTPDKCIEAVQAIEEMAARGTISEDAATARQSRVRVALEVHRSTAGERALEMLEEAGRTPFYGRADMTDEERVDAFRKHLILGSTNGNN